MAKLFNDVWPGDLIAASFMNNILAEIQSLEDRLTKLEAGTAPGGGVVITGFTPSGPFHVGDRVEVNGIGFQVPPELNQVTIGGVPVPAQNFRFGSSDKKIILDIPDVPGLSMQGAVVNVVVSNVHGTASSSLTLLPKSVVPQGFVQVDYVNPPILPVIDPNIHAGTYTFIFSITAFADRAGTYLITPTITGPGAWTAQVLQGNTLGIPAGTSGVRRDVAVQVIVPGGLQNGDVGTLVLAITETSPGTKVIPGSKQIQITFGSPPPTPETRVRASLQGAAGGAALVGGNVQFTRNNPGAVQIRIACTEAGTYSVTAAMRDPVGWTSGGIDIPTFQLPQPPQGSTSNQQINIAFTAVAGAGATDLLVTVTRSPDISVQYVQKVTLV